MLLFNTWASYFHIKPFHYCVRVIWIIYIYIYIYNYCMHNNNIGLKIIVHFIILYFILPGIMYLHVVYPLLYIYT
jgi:hypothetical protein